MDESDWDIYYWATEKRTPPERWTGSRLPEKPKAHARNEGELVRWMPDLHS
jgi:succinate dehydrogenase assembly factor 2